MGLNDNEDPKVKLEFTIQQTTGKLKTQLQTGFQSLVKNRNAIEFSAANYRKAAPLVGKTFKEPILIVIPPDMQFDLQRLF